MTAYDFIQRFILFVIPGFITFSLFCHLADKRVGSEVVALAMVFIASLVSFLLGDLFIVLLNLIPKVEFKLVDLSRIISGNTDTLTSAGIIAAIISSIVVAYFSVFVWDRNYLFRVANRLKITTRVGNGDVWDNLFEKQPWIILRDYVTRNTYYGRVGQYSDGAATRELLLEEVTVWDAEIGEYQMEKVYLIRAVSEFSIEIADYTKENKENAEKDRELHTTA